MLLGYTYQIHSDYVTNNFAGQIIPSYSGTTDFIYMLWNLASMVLNLDEDIT
jgi:hypothetical protein